MTKALHIPAGVSARFSARLQKMVRTMRRDAENKIRKLLKSPEAKKFFALDESFNARAERLLREMDESYNELFSKFGNKAVRRMIFEANHESDVKLKSAFDDLETHYDVDLKFDIGKMPQKVKSVLDASTDEATSLIKSIPQQYMDRVRSEILRSIVSGRGGFSRIMDTVRHYGAMTTARARRIAKDQTKKAFSGLNIAKAKTAGITKGVWVHSGSPVHPRIKHKNFDGKIFDLMKGAPIGDKGQFVMPAEEPFCSCVWKPILSF